MFSTVFTLALLAFAVVVWMWYSGMFRRFVPNAEKVIPLMTPVATKPESRLQGDTRSELLVVGQYVPGGNLTLYRELVVYRITDGAWFGDKTGKPVDMEITHWLKASEQDKLN